VSLKLLNILFFGPIDAFTYEYKKNKKPSLIILVSKEGKNYNPSFVLKFILKANKRNINVSEYFNKKKIDIIDDNTSIYLKEYDYDSQILLNNHYKLIKKKLDLKQKILMQF
jgi:hypothetical protein